MEEATKKLNRLLSDAGSRHLGRPVAVENLRPLSGGASAETWQFEIREEGQTRKSILRLASPGHEKDNIRLDRSVEARLQQLAAEAGVPVAPVLFILEPEDNLGPGYAMACVEGETLARKILRDEALTRARSVMAEQCGRILAGIHGINTGLLPPLREYPAARVLDELKALYDAFNQIHPVFELAFHWLEAHIPESGALRLVHGDFRNGNFIVGEEGIRAVLDWEVAHLGDPMEDLGWICVNSWRFGNIDRPVGGFGHREQLFSGYETAGGGTVDPAAVHFWELFGTLKWGVICILQAFTHLGGAKRSVELAAIGRRVSETEVDLMNLIDGGTIE
jgi:aminoglycoside phosphotransferase (APT) family kinase protein